MHSGGGAGGNICADARSSMDTAVRALHHRRAVTMMFTAVDGHERDTTTNEDLSHSLPACLRRT